MVQREESNLCLLFHFHAFPHSWRIRDEKNKQGIDKESARYIINQTH